MINKTKNILQMRFIFIFLMALTACHQNPKSETVTTSTGNTDNTDSGQIKTDTVKVKFTAAMVDNKKDPNCGMPVTAGIKDTVHYNGKVYGFCSDECKQAFLKNPVAEAKAAEMK